MIPSNYNNIHDMILVWRTEFLKEGTAIAFIVLSALAVVSQAIHMVLAIIVYVFGK